MTRILAGGPKASAWAGWLAGSVLAAGAGAGLLMQVGVRPPWPVAAHQARVPAGTAGDLGQVGPIGRVEWVRPSDALDRPALTVALHPVGTEPTLALQSARLGAVAAPTRMAAPQASRCVVYLLDISGSMRPYQSEARRQLALLAQDLAEGDTFNVIAFAGDTLSFAADPVAPVDSSFLGVQAWLDGLPEKSGTNLEPALRQALRTPGLTSVVLISDGEAWQQPERRSSLVALIERENPYAAVVREIVLGPSDRTLEQLIPGPGPGRTGSNRSEAQVGVPGQEQP